MGIDRHAYNFISREARKEHLGDVLTIGRQNLSDEVLRALKLDNIFATSGAYAEKTLIDLGADSVSSIDYSDYENPTFVADLGEQIDVRRSFNTVLDCGSLEHIFDVAQAFRNVINLTAVGGKIIHILPVNNLSGHGFWQFSSDLLFSLYSPENGFSGTQVFYASSIDHSHWYECPNPISGTRNELASLEPIILLSVTQKISNAPFLRVNQPFYTSAWESKSPPALARQSGRKMKKIIGRISFVYKLVRNSGLILFLCLGRGPYSIKRFKPRKTISRFASRDRL